MTELILIATAATVISILAGTVILFGLARLLRFREITLLRALAIFFPTLLAGWIVNIPITYAGIPLLGEIAVLIASFFVFHTLFKRFSQARLTKSLGVFALLYVLLVVFLLVLILFFRQFIAFPFYVSGNSMDPTYQEGDYLIVSKLETAIERGDNIIFQHPKNPDEFFLKRVVGLPGENIRVSAEGLFIDGEPRSDYTNAKTTGDIELTLRENEYFVLGDNRESSLDSRNFGPVRENLIIGEVLSTLYTGQAE